VTPAAASLPLLSELPLLSGCLWPSEPPPAHEMIEAE
jgi:hypothetical protein